MGKVRFKKVVHLQFCIAAVAQIMLLLLFWKRGCGGLTLAEGQVPTKAALLILSSAGQERENITKNSWIEIRTGRNHSTITITGTINLGKINFIY